MDSFQGLLRVFGCVLAGGMHCDLSPAQSESVCGAAGFAGSTVGGVSWGASALEKL